MATYITLMRWTEQGIARVKDSPKRLDAGRKAFKKMGVEIKDTWLTMGKYDLVCVVEGADLRNTDGRSIETSCPAMIQTWSRHTTYQKGLVRSSD